MRILLLATVVLAGCLEAEDDVVQLAEDFEGCGGCTWTFTGDVTIVTTNHPGEHAARLGAGAVLAHPRRIERFVDGPDDGNYDYEDFSDGNWLEYSTDCTDLPGFEPSEGVVFTECETDGISYRLTTTHPRSTKTCTWNSVGDPVLDCSPKS